MRSLSALALGLSLASITSARVANTPAEVQRRNNESQSEKSIWNLYGIFKRLEKKAALATCYQDDFYYAVFNSSWGERLCAEIMNYPNNTVTVGYTPVSTYYYTYTTQYIGTETLVTTVPASTETVTASPIVQRAADSEITAAPQARDVSDMAAAMEKFRGRLANDTSMPPEAWTASFSSACGCQTYAGLVVTATSTASTRVVTVSAFYQGTTTTAATQTSGTVTTTVDASSAATSDEVSEEPPSTTDSGPGPAPTAPGFQCPEDNNSTVSQLVGPERYDYLVLCDTDISDNDFYDRLHYDTYSQCAAACSVANQRFDLPVCQGFSYYATSNSAGNNCFLKGSAETTVAAVGVDSGILLNIAVGVNSSSPSGTATESGPFPEQTTVDPVAASSSLEQILTGSSTSISVVTPTGKPQLPGTGLLVNDPGITSYSTYVSDGSTYSSGTVFSTYWSSDGSWYWSYFTSYTQSWASATTVYGSSETSTSISNSSSSGTDVQSGGPSGEYWMITTTNYTYYYPGGYNVTQVIANETYAANGTEISAATTTLFYVYSTGGAGGIGGSGQNAPSSVSAGIVTSASTWTSVSSTQFVVTGGGGQGGQGGAGGGGAVQTPGPSVVTNTFGTAWSSGAVASGEVASTATIISGGTGGPLTPISSTVISGGTGFGFSTGGSGVVRSSGAPLTPISSTLISGGTGFVSQTGGSGAGPSPTPITSVVVSSATGGASSTGGAGFSNSNNNRSGTESTTTPLPTGSSPSSGLLTPISSTSGVSGTGGASSTGGSGNGTSPLPSGTGSVPFSAPSGPRSGTESTSTPSSTGSAPFSAPSGPRSGTLSTSAPFATGGTTFTEEIPFSTASVPYPFSSGAVPPFSAPSGPRTPGLPSTGTLPLSTGVFSTGTSPFSSGIPPFSAPSGPRTPGLPSSSTPLFPTGTSPPFVSPTTCVTNILGTTTIFVTTTEFGCYSNCPPAGYGAPLTYGPPAASQRAGSGGRQE
ncbi:hypothetical protein AC578_421 [Pseudocercospora eumusae]|uniref:Apple domain-containing protein n=1 Tax=Pseudocercospora eumusae TaxID=321146 RepID=A0A139HXZ3_9PEZI|nr:hypothetical protein AC578_421 [Pseudocercospora eumusae]